MGIVMIAKPNLIHYRKKLFTTKSKTKDAALHHHKYGVVDDLIHNSD